MSIIVNKFLDIKRVQVNTRNNGTTDLYVSDLSNNINISVLKGCDYDTDCSLKSMEGKKIRLILEVVE